MDRRDKIIIGLRKLRLIFYLDDEMSWKDNMYWQSKVLLLLKRRKALGVTYIVLTSTWQWRRVVCMYYLTIPSAICNASAPVRCLRREALTSSALRRLRRLRDGDVVLRRCVDVRVGNVRERWIVTSDRDGDTYLRKVGIQVSAFMRWEEAAHFKYL